MYQIDSATAAVSQPAATAAGTAGYFTDGNPATSTPATIVTAEWLNAVMMELANVVTGAGLTLSKPAYNQVLLAIKRLIQNQVVLTDTGSANAYAATNSPALVSGTWTNGVTQQVKITNTNTSTSTYSPDGLTAIPIYGLGLQPIQGGELIAGGTAILMKQTIAGVNSGNPICVLMECSGGAQQVPAASQGYHAVNFSQVIGLGQTLQNVTGSRAIGTTYTNGTGKPIFVYATAVSAGASTAIFGQVGGITTSITPVTTTATGVGICFLVPAGATYAIQQTGSLTLSAWNEFR